MGLSGRRIPSHTTSALAHESSSNSGESSFLDNASDFSFRDAPSKPYTAHSRTTSRSIPDRSATDANLLSRSTAGHARVPSILSRQRGLSPTQVKNPAVRAAQISTDAANGISSTVPLNIKTRRQSHFPPPTTLTTDSKSPRKSIGPGISITNAAERQAKATAQADDAGMPVLSATTSRKTSSASVTNKPRLSMGGPSVTPMATIDRLARPKRDVKAQSMQPAPRAMPPPAPGSSSQKADDLPAHTSALISRSPARPALWRTNTPQAASRRQSIVSGRASGLGARTISPTDARRYKRMSTMPPSGDQPEVPHPTPTPPPETTLLHRTLPSPAPPPKLRMSTSASNRGTPDLTSKLGGQRTVSSRASYTSTRPSSSSGVQRPGSAGKGRSDRGSGGTENEIVPPVPKIPTAFESPSEAKDHQFFQEVLSSFAAPENGQGALASAEQADSFATLINSIGTASADTPSQQPQQPKTLQAHGQASTKRGSAVPARLEGSKTGHTQHTRQYSNVPRLPPLNLAPLTTPANSKMPSRQASHDLSSNGASHTPPPRANANKTPSTPLTASKATFTSHNLRHDFDWDDFAYTRTGTAYDARESGSMTMLPGSRSASPDTFASFSPATPGPVKSPAVSTTPGIEEALATKAMNLATRSRTQSNASNHLGRRSRATSKNGKESQLGQVENGEEKQSSLRRRLSMSWRKTSNKNLQQSRHDDSAKPSPTTTDMPPPKLPASLSLANMKKAVSSKADGAAKSGSQTHSRAPSTSAAPSVQATASGPRKSLAESASSSSSNLVGEAPMPKEKEKEKEAKVPKSESSHSFFKPMQNMLHSRSSHAAKIPSPDMRLDKDDLAAEEEMKKLASRKKDFEASARELEEMKRKACPKERVSAAQASKIASLNIFERGEVIDYKEVYFTGTRSAKKYVGDLSSTANNFGFDDDRGDYNIVLGDHLAYRHEVVDVLGKGSFGQVVRCIDHKTGQLVAIKIIRNKKRFHQQALVEVNILQRLREWDPNNKHSMINFTQSFYFRGHLCISTELLGINLYEFIKAHDFRGFSLKLIRRFTKQMLSSLCLLQTKKVIHCDLKPENILLAHPLHSEIKVIDFGSSCLENEKVYTYIQSRFYRSPEVILGMNYGMPIDMWSLGCILAELLTGYPIFPGENEQEQLACIMEVFGPPEKHLIERATRKKLFFDSLGKPRVTVSSKGKRRRPSSKTLQQSLKCDDEAFLDFITRCLRWDPDKRLKPDEAIQHEFVTGVKKAVRSRAPLRVASDRPISPSKRPSASGSVGRARPLPEPPASASSNAARAGHGSHEFLSVSPAKNASGAPSRRQSTLQATPALASKRVSMGPNVSSGLPRANARSFSGKPDLASAAAIASLQNQH